MVKGDKFNEYFIYVLAFVSVGALLYITGSVLSGKPDVEVPVKFGIGRPAKPNEIAALDIDVMPDGRGLPKGSGNVQEGRLIYNQKCISCHGNGEKTEVKLPGEALFSNRSDGKAKTIGTYWPYATTVFDYVRRAMPFNAPGSLTDKEVYHLTAYLLYANKLITKETVIDQETLPGVTMPAKKRYVNDDREGGTVIR